MATENPVTAPEQTVPIQEAATPGVMNGNEPPVKTQPSTQPTISKEQQAALDKINFVTDNIGQIASKNAQDQNFYTRPYSYDPASNANPNQNFERYYSHKSFKDLGFNPWQDNETLYNEKGSAWGDVWRATQAGAKMIPTGFMSAIRSYGDVLNGDLMAQDEDSAKEMKRLNMQGMSTRGGVAGFTANLITNAGYTVGLGLEMAAEAGIGALLTPETGGASAGLAVTRITQNAKNLGKYFNVVQGFNDAMGSLKNFSAAKTAYEGFKTAGRFVNPLSNTWEALNASENLANLARVSKTAAGFHKDVMMANATLSEAKMEGASTTMDLEEELIAKYYQDKGEYPSSEELLRIKNTAQEAGDKALAWNIPIIMLTNKITLDPLFKRFVPMEDYITKAGTKFIEKKGVGFVEEGFGTGIKGLLKPKVYGKAGLTYFKENFSEGIQESLQDVISNTSKNYYTDIYNNASKQGVDQSTGEQYTPSFAGVLGKSVADQFSGQGFETFASGFFMGGLMKIQGAVVQGSKESYNRLFNKERYAEYKKNKAEYNAKTLTQLNELYKDPLKYFGSRVTNFANTASTVDNQQRAADKNDHKAWQDVDDQNVWSHISTALETGTYNVFLDKMKAVKTMTPEAIKEAYGVDGPEVLGKINRILERAQYIKNNYDTWNNKAPNPFKPEAFPKDSPEYIREAVAKSAWEQAKRNAIFYGYSFSRNAERIASVKQDVLNNKTFTELNSLDITPLFDVKAINKELSLLKQEISTLKSADVIAIKNDLVKKQTKFERLQELRQNLENYYIQQAAEGMPEEERGTFFQDFKNYKETTDKDLKKSYKAYLKHVAAQSNVFYLGDIDVDNSYKALKDIHTLNSENRNLTESINMLSNPKGFYDHYDRLNKTMNDMFDNKEEDLRRGIEDTYARMELNSLLNNLYKLGFVVNQKDIQELVAEGKMPEQFYNVISKQTVNRGASRDYVTFEAVINDYLGAKKGAPVVVEEVVGAGVAEVIPDEEYNDFVDNNNASAERLRLIATKVANKEPLSIRENAIFTGKTAEVNEIIATRAVPIVTEIVIKGAPTVIYNVQGKLAEIKTGEDLAAAQNEVMAILSDYDRTIAAGITQEVEKELLEGLLQKAKTLQEEFDPENIKEGNIVEMREKRYGKMILTKISGDRYSFKRLDEDETALYIIKKNKLKESIKFKYSEKMTTPTGPEMTKEEKEKAEKNQESTDNFMQDTATLKELQSQAEQEGSEKVTNDFINNLGCK